MRLTNTTGLPDTLVRVAEKLANNHPAFDRSKYSATELLKSERQIVLGRRFADQIEMDVQDTFSMWNGTAIHALLESEANGIEGYEPERRLEAEFDGITLSGQYDLYETATDTIIDYKTSKVANIDKNRTLKEDKWLRQLYLYRRLRKENGLSVPKKGRIIAMATDFSKMKIGTKGYPEHPIQILEWDLDDEAFEEEVLYEALEKARMAKDVIERGLEPADCTFSDCWCTEDYAIMKPDAKRAQARFDTFDEAFSKRLEMPNKDDMRIYHRVSDFVNCRNYCQCAPFCEQWKRNQDHEEIKEDVTDYAPF